MILEYNKTFDIRNTDQLPRGTGCKYLEALVDQRNGVFIAKRWRRTLSAPIPSGSVIIKFAA